MSTSSAGPGVPPLLAIERLSIAFGQEPHSVVAVHDVSLTIGRGEIVGLVGESGSGKSLTCRSALRLMPPGGHIRSGAVNFDGRDVLALSASELRNMRVRDIGMIFQDPFTSLNPTRRIGQQISETLRVNVGLSKRGAYGEAIELLNRVDIAEPERRYLVYPHELSGGMRQRVMIALAIAAGPKLLVADEPTTALDVTTQAQILALLGRLREEKGMAILLVSHDFGVIAQGCDRVAVMYGGYVVESGTVERVYSRPQHPYTAALLDAIPSLESAGKRRRRHGIAGQPPAPGENLSGCPFAPRCAFVRPTCSKITMQLEEVGDAHLSACPFAREARGGVGYPIRPDLETRVMSNRGGDPILEVRDLFKQFSLRPSILGRLQLGSREFKVAVNRVSFALERGEILGIAGGSGSGKSTLARCIVRLVEPDDGQILFGGYDIRRLRGVAVRDARRRIQMVFQDPYASLNPQMSVGDAILEAGRVHDQLGAEEPRRFVQDRLERVHLNSNLAKRRPRDLSGGQRQRVAIARALATGPEVLIADEAVSALDVSIQTQILNLFLDLRDELGLSIIFVSHQLSVLAEVADRVAIIQHGSIVEMGATATVFESPQHPYTAALLAAHPHPRFVLE